MAFASSIDHLLAEVARVELLLSAHALATVQPPEGARRIVSPEEQIHALLDRAASPPEAPAAALAARAEAERLAAAIAARRAEGAARGPALRLPQLAERFGLESSDLDLLLVALVPEMPATDGPRGAPRERFSVGFALAALYPTAAAQIAALRRLWPGAPLLRHGLVRIVAEAGAARLPLPARALEIEQRFLSFLLGDDAVDPPLEQHLQQTGRMSTFGRALPARHAWDDLVLPADRKAMLREICLHFRHRGRVYGDWGFERKLAHGKSLSALFAGPPGTGKTMAAGVIAREMGVPMFHIDLSTVVSKFIGETEKHLAELFAEAEAVSAALFFDEADALFARRTEVRDAHDRYANMETSYLLQRIEGYDGVVLLATNFQKNLDEAFLRRLAFVVEFPFPGPAERLRIWQSLFPAEAPRDPDVDLDFLAQRVELSGGYIRNIALAAAFLAAEEPASIAMRHLLHATRREFQKMGKVVDLGALAYRP